MELHPIAITGGDSSMARPTLHSLEIFTRGPCWGCEILSPSEQTATRSGGERFHRRFKYISVTVK